MIHEKPKRNRVRSILKTEPQHTPYSFSEFPKDEPGVIYVRQSSYKQIQNNIYSFEMQTDKFLEYFRNKMGCTNVIEIIADDEGVSGTKDIHERQGLSRVMRLINGEELLNSQRLGWIGAVHVNRLTRDKWLVTPGTIMKDCFENNVWIATLRMNFNFEDTYCQRVFMLEAEESARHLEWMKLVLGGGLLAASMKGLYDGRWISPGYIVNRSDEKNKKYAIYEPHAEVVRWLFRRFFELDGNFGLLCREVAKMPFLFPAFETWVDSKTTSKFVGNRIKRSSRIMEGPNAGCYRGTRHGLLNILCNPLYIGWWLPRGGGVVENNHESIVEEYLFTYAHKRLSSYDLTGERQKPERIRRSGAEGKGILKKVLYDDQDKLMYVHSSTEKDKQTRYRSYHSNSGLIHTYRFSVPTEEYDQIFLEKLFEGIHVLEEIEGWADKLQEQLAIRLREHEQRKNLIRKQIEQARKQRTEIKATLDDPEIPKSKQMKIEYANQIIGLEQKINQLDVDLAKPLARGEDDEATLYQIHLLLPDIKAEWDNLSFEVRLRFVGSLVRKIVLTPVAPSWMKLEVYWKRAIGDFIDVKHIRQPQANRLSWTEEEYAILREMFPTVEPVEILKKLPHRTWRSIRKVAYNTLKLTREPTKLIPTDSYYINSWSSWSDEEKSILCQMYSKAEATAILERLPGRTWIGIKRQANELDLLRDRGGKADNKKLPDTIQSAGTPRLGAWSEKEDAILREMYPSAKAEEILEQLSGRGWIGIRSRAFELKISRERRTRVVTSISYVDPEDLKYEEKNGLTHSADGDWQTIPVTSAKNDDGRGPVTLPDGQAFTSAKI